MKEESRFSISMDEDYCLTICPCRMTCYVILRVRSHGNSTVLIQHHFFMVQTSKLQTIHCHREHYGYISTVQYMRPVLAVNETFSA